MGEGLKKVYKAIKEQRKRLKKPTHKNGGDGE